MSRIYDALKKLEAQRLAGGGANGHGAEGRGNGSGHHANGNANGNGNGNGKRHGWRAWFQTNGHTNGHRSLTLDFKLGPEVEEAYQRLGTNLLVAPEHDPARSQKLLGVTASRHGEGTTTTAAVFASILVRRRGGRVAVVEANFRTPSCDAAFGVKRNGGFAEFIEGRETLANVAQPSRLGNLFVVTCGHSELTPAALFDSPGLTAALAQLREHFDFVVFDLPPVNVYSDASILAPRLDAALIVIEADRTRIPEVERTRRTLDRVGVKVVGSVLNRRRNYIPSFLEELL